MLGVAAYAAYYCVLALTLDGFLSHAEAVLKEGVTVGCFSTVISSFLDKLTGATKLSGQALIVRSLLQGFLPEKAVEECAKKVALCFSSGYGAAELSAAEKAVGETLTAAGEEAVAEDVASLVRLIAVTLKKTAQGKQDAS